VVCNSGTRLVPTIDGTMHHFDNVGLYDALFVMQDQESKTLWNHITGEAQYGPLVGTSLGPVGNLLQMNVEQALELDPSMHVAISDRRYFAGGRAFDGNGPVVEAGGAGSPAGPAGRGRAGGAGAGPGGRNELSPMFSATLGAEDTRLPRMSMGLGVVTAETVRFYPMDRIVERGEALIDEIGGRRLLVYVDPDTNTPAALFVDASSAALAGKEVRLDTGAVVRSGLIYDAAGRRLDSERPQQLFSRWYGFALTFPGPEIYGR
jgi:hypothetical protein